MVYAPERRDKDVFPFQNKAESLDPDCSGRRKLILVQLHVSFRYLESF